MTARFSATLVMENVAEHTSKWQMLGHRIRHAVSNLWSTTALSDSKGDAYAARLMLEETRPRIALMATPSLVTQIAVVVLYFQLGVDGSFFYGRNKGTFYFSFSEK